MPSATDPPSRIDRSSSGPDLHEMLRIMDVARTLRAEQDTVLQQFNLAQTKAHLRERLLKSTEITGEQLSEAEVDAAIDLYYDNLHTFQPPPRSLSLLLAHLYVRRKRIATAIVAGLAGYLLLRWWTS